MMRLGLALSLLVGLVGCSFSATDAGAPNAGDPSGPDAGATGATGIVFDAHSQAAVTDERSLTWRHTVGTSDRAALFVGASIEKDGAVAEAITYGGIALTRSTVVVGGEGVRAELWYLSQPPVGEADVIVTFSNQLGTDGSVCGAISFGGVDVSAPIESLATNGDTSGSPSTTITTGDDGAWLFDVVIIDNGDSVTAMGSQLARWGEGHEIAGSGSTLQSVAPGPHEMRWASTSDNWAQIVAAVRPGR
jgi:hypothetical protein